MGTKEEYRQAARLAVAQKLFSIDYRGSSSISTWHCILEPFTIHFAYGAWGPTVKSSRVGAGWIHSSEVLAKAISAINGLGRWERVRRDDFRVLLARQECARKRIALSTIPVHNIYAHSTDLQPLSPPIHAPHYEETTGLFMKLHGKDLRSNKVDLKGVWRFLESAGFVVLVGYEDTKLPCFSRTFTIMDA